jgi:Flp pilus assembly protein TadG
MKNIVVTNIRHRKFHKNKGVVLIWVALFLILMMLFVGLALDTAKIYLVSHQLQNAADASALAGARLVRFDQALARQAAIDIAMANKADSQNVQLAANLANDPLGDIVLGRYSMWNSIFTPTTLAPNAMKVYTRRTDPSLGGPVPLNFGPIVNIDTGNVARYAIAMTIGGTGAGLIALSPGGTGLHINGDVNLNVNDGAIQVNSEEDDAVRIIGQPQISAGELNITGEADPTGGFDFTIDFPVNTGVAPIPDPLCPNPPVSCLPEPVWNSADDLSPSPGETIDITGGSVTLDPGYYSGGFRITGGDVVLKPGLYILDGSSSGQKSGLVIGGNTNFCAKGVMFFITGDGVVDLAGSGNIVTTPIIYDSYDFCDSGFSYPAGVDYIYEGMGIFQARDNYNDARIVGTSMLDLEGTLYFPENHLDLTGTGDGFGNQLIADTVEVSGTGDITIMYDGRNYNVVPTRSILVE